MRLGGLKCLYLTVALVASASARADGEEAAAPETPPSPTTRPQTRANEPAFVRHQTHWGLQMAYAPYTFTKSPTFQNSAVSVHSFSLGADYQPGFSQGKYGILGIGASMTLYLPSPSATLTSSSLGFYSAGTLLRYQAHYWQGQIVVPCVGWGLEYFRYQFIGQTSDALVQNGPFLGVFVLLSDIDRVASREMYESTGISRTYFIAEMRGTSSGDQALPISPGDWYFGFRFEF